MKTKIRSLSMVSALGLGAASLTAGLSSAPRASAQTLPIATDYAVEAFGDAWDWNNVEDGAPSRDVLSSGIESSSIANGQVNFGVDKSSFWFFLQGGYADSTPTGRDANLHPVDTSRYNRIVMRISASQRLSAGLLWFGCSEGANCVGGIPLDIMPGTRDYDIALGRNVFGTLPWSGKITAMRLDFSPSSTTQVSIDWIRLTNQGSGTIGEWAGPVPVVVDPDISGGDDFATLTRNGDAWDFDKPTDYLRADNATVKVEGGMLHGANAGPSLNDPSVTMKVPVAFNGSDFHRITVKWAFDGPFSLRDEPGGGTNARVVWRIAGTPATPDGKDLQESRDVVMYPTEPEFTIDLATNPASAVVDPRPGKEKIGWAGQKIELVRFDPNEDPGHRTWRIDNIKLAADDAAETSFDIKLADLNPGPGTTADVYVDRDNVGYDGTLIANGVDLSSGQATVPFAPGPGAGGTYWVYTVVKRNNYTVTRYSSGPVQMGKKSGPGAYQFGPAVGGPASQVGIADVPEPGTAPAPSAPVAPAPITVPPTPTTVPAALGLLIPKSGAKLPVKGRKTTKAKAAKSAVAKTGLAKP